MAEDLQTNLEMYKVQFQQVEAALIGEPDNEELKKLKIDLEEIINITQELLQSGNTIAETSAGGDSSSAGATSYVEEVKPVKDWKVGEKCMAIWSKNGQYFEAVIDGISEGKAAVTFVNYNVTEINKLTQLQIFQEIPVKKYLWDTKPKTGKTQWQVEKEKRRLKALKKTQRSKQLEEEKEKDKNKWKDFNRKALAKSFKGVKKESIFASTDRSGGKIGVGTCGTSGKPMTKYSQQEKLKQTASSAASKSNYSMF